MDIVYAWENPLHDCIHEFRKKEMKQVGKVFNARAVIATMV